MHVLNNDTQKTSASEQSFQLSDLLVQMMGNIETARDAVSIKGMPTRGARDKRGRRLQTVVQK